MLEILPPFMTNPPGNIFRDAWLGRKSGVLAQITDNWLKPAPPDLKRAVGAGLNELRAHVESQIESRRQAIESGADQSALVARTRRPLSPRRRSVPSARIT